MPKKHRGKKSVSPPARYPSGDRRPETGKGHPPALVKRIMDHAVALGADQRVGSVLGLMFLRGELTERQTEAGMRFAELVGKYERIKGRPRRSAKSASYEAGFGDGGGIDLSRLPPVEREQAEKRLARRIRRIEKQHERAQAVIPMFPIIVKGVVEEVCCNDRPVHSAHNHDLITILNRLAEHFKVMAPAEHKAQQKTKPRNDAKHLADAAVDALERRFTDERATPAAFDLSRGNGEDRQIIAMGTARDGKTAVEYTVEVPVRDKLVAAALDAQLVKAAEAKGWSQATRRRRFEPSRKRRAA